MAGTNTRNVFRCGTPFVFTNGGFTPSFIKVGMCTSRNSHSPISYLSLRVSFSFSRQIISINSSFGNSLNPSMLTVHGFV